MKRLFLCLALAASTAASAQLEMPSKYKTPPPKPGQAVAKVGGKSIFAGEVEPYLWEWLGKGATDDIISYVLVLQDSGKRGVVAADSEVDKEVDAEIASVRASQGGSSEQAAEWLRGQGFTRSRLFMRLKAKLLMDKVLEGGFHPETYVKVATILVKAPSADASKVAEAIAKAQDAYKQLQTGQAWDNVLASVTTDKNVLKTHGVLGWRELSAFPDSVQREFSALRDGGFTHAAQTKNGIQIFRVDAHGGDAKGKELEALKALYMEGARPAYIARLKSQAGVENLVK